MAEIVDLHFRDRTQGSNNAISDTERAWAAGFFEGEGAVIIAYNSSNCPSPGLSLRVGQVDKTPLMWLKSRWGGTIVFRQSEKVNGRNFYVWYMRTRQAAKFLKDIRPFVVRDRVIRRIDLAVRFQNQKVKQGFGRYLGLPAYRASQLYYFNEMKKLNMRGADADADMESEQEQEVPDQQLEFLL